MKKIIFVTDYLSTYDVIVLTHQSDQKSIWPFLLSNCILLDETFHDYSFWEALCKILKKSKMAHFLMTSSFFHFFTRNMNIAFIPV